MYKDVPELNEEDIKNPPLGRVLRVFVSFF